MSELLLPPGPDAGVVVQVLVVAFISAVPASIEGRLGAVGRFLR